MHDRLRDVLGLEHLADLPRRQVAEYERAITRPDQTGDLQPEMLQHAADFAVLAFRQGDGDPQVRALRPFLDLVQRRLDGAVVYALDGDAVLEPVELVLSDPAARPGAVLDSAGNAATIPPSTFAVDAAPDTARARFAGFLPDARVARDSAFTLRPPASARASGSRSPSPSPRPPRA